jgi:N-acyl-L-homoserine lactone synthetase
VDGFFFGSIQYSRAGGHNKLYLVWKAQMHAMLQSIPTMMSFINDDETDIEPENNYSFSINSRLAN